MGGAPIRKLNLGCGFDKREGFVNADGFPECAPDVLMDIETFPWPFDDNAFDEILMKHVLEHVGATFDGFAAVMGELYRVLAPGGQLEIHVPHYRHGTFWSDPTHVRAFTLETFEMMSKAENDRRLAQGLDGTRLAHLMGVDFETDEQVQSLDRVWNDKRKAGEMSTDDLRREAAGKWGVVRELKVKLKAVK